jgi:serine/threonine-protein kinase
MAVFADGGALMQVTLTVTAGPNTGKVFTFSGHDVFIVGRSKRAHFQLPGTDRYFSRIHFMIEVNPPQCRLMDMGSRNGTHVNGQRVQTADLKDGDQIKGGHTILRVAVQPDEPVDPSVHEATTVPPVVVAPIATMPFPGPVVTPVAAPTTVACRVCGASMPESRTGPSLCPACRAEADQQPQPIGGYRIVRELGRGGMGVVYQALREADDSLVALKTIIPEGAPSPADLRRFLREAEILRGLDHPHIIAFRDMGTSNGQLFFAMDFIPGTDAAHILSDQGPLSVSRAVRLICQLLEALEYAHARKFIHRDLKPANLLVMQVNGRDVVKLADFGLARTYQSTALSGLTMTGAIAGTVPFMPPEQIVNFRGVTPQADQYSAAATLYNLLTGKYVYDLPSLIQDQLLRVLQDDPVPIQSRRPSLPKGLAAVIHRALAREPKDRFPDARAMRKALLKFIEKG